MIDKLINTVAEAIRNSKVSELWFKTQKNNEEMVNITIYPYYIPNVKQGDIDYDFYPFLMVYQGFGDVENTTPVNYANTSVVLEYGIYDPETNEGLKNCSILTDALLTWAIEDRTLANRFTLTGKPVWGTEPDLKSHRRQGGPYFHDVIMLNYRYPYVSGASVPGNFWNPPQ